MPGLLYGSKDTVIEFVKSRLNPDIDNFGLCESIGIIDKSETLIAGVVYNNFYGRDIQATIASRNPGWASHRVLHAIFAYPFIQLGCSRITAQTRSSNGHARQFLLRLGFQQEGILRNWYENEDAIVMGMIKSECRWINK